MFHRTFERTFLKLSTKLFAKSVQKRSLHIHEYQAQKLFRTAGINVPNGNVAETPTEALKIAEVLGGQDLVIKAQILAGGRGKGTFENGLKGGVHTCASAEEVRDYAEGMLGHVLSTKQTGLSGKTVSKVLVAERKYLRKELYVAFLMDRKTGGPVVVCSPFGGMDIETVARDNPEAIFVEPIDIMKGITVENTLNIANKLGFSHKVIGTAQEQLSKLYDFFIKNDCTLLEINPLAETNSGEVMCMDAKVNFDDNAAFRHKDLFELRDPSQEDPREVAAQKFELNYIGLDGSIGCLVNGAGLAMATMDLITLHKASPANFLDVGGGATQKQVSEAIRIISLDPRVKSILVNIFGGIAQCDIIARGLIGAVIEYQIKIPLVVRLQGTNVKEAKKIMEESGLRLIPCDDLDEASNKAVRMAEIMSLAQEAKVDVQFQLPL